MVYLPAGSSPSKYRSTNPARRRATSLIGHNALPLRQCVRNAFMYGRQNAAAGESQDNSASSPLSVRRCPVLAAFYENASTPRSAVDRYIRLCSIVATSRAVDAVAMNRASGGGAQRKRLVYTSTSNQLYIHVVNTTADHAANDHILLRYDGPCLVHARIPLQSVLRLIIHLLYRTTRRFLHNLLLIFVANLFYIRCGFVF